MKLLKILNTIAIGLPIILALLGLFDNGMFLYALLSTMATGFIQVVIGILFWIKETQNQFIIGYLIGVLLFFIGIHFTSITTLWILPPILCIYLSLIIYTQKA